MKTLDVGCGDKPRGNVNCDIYKTVNPQIKQTTITHVTPQKIRNFVLASGEHLPFKDKVFQKVFSSHTIEHADNPTLFLKELIRVCKGEVTVVCPHRFSGAAKGKYHKHYFNVTWFSKTLANMVCDIKVKYNSRLFFVPVELTVTIFLAGKND